MHVCSILRYIFLCKAPRTKAITLIIINIFLSWFCGRAAEVFCTAQCTDIFPEIYVHTDETMHYDVFFCIMWVCRSDNESIRNSSFHQNFWTMTGLIWQLWPSKINISIHKISSQKNSLWSSKNYQFHYLPFENTWSPWWYFLVVDAHHLRIEL